MWEPTFCKSGFMNYIEVKVGKGVSDERKVLTEEIAKWWVGQLLPKVRTLDITIELLDELDKGADGYQWVGGDNKEHFIEINENQYYDDFVTAVMHEMVHVKQDYRKDNRTIKEKEKEAYEQQEVLYERWLENDNWINNRGITDNDTHRYG